MREGITPGRLLIAAMLITAGIQFVPYGRDHTNPPTASEPVWDSRETRELFYQVCGDCHSNATVWPWYSHVAPMSWLVQSDVEEAREHFDVSNWKGQEQDADEAYDEFEEGDMPLWFYLPLHPSADLAEADRARLLQGLAATFGQEDEDEDEDSDSEEHESEG